jgi:hypothetical protein
MRVFQGARLRGFTWKGRYKNMLFDIYERLVVHCDQYREKSKEMRELEKNLQEEIKIFHKNNDLGSMIGFLRNLDNHSIHGGMEGGMETGIAESLQKKLLIQPPVFESRQEAILQPLPPLASIKSRLKDMINKAYRLHGGSFRIFFAQELSQQTRVPR